MKLLDPNDDFLVQFSFLISNSFTSFYIKVNCLSSTQEHSLEVAYNSKFLSVYIQGKCWGSCFATALQNPMNEQWVVTSDIP